MRVDKLWICNEDDMVGIRFGGLFLGQLIIFSVSAQTLSCILDVPTDSKCNRLSSV